MIKIVFFVFCFLSIIPVYGQKKTYSLSKKLNEISGICIYNDSLIFAHNDGGNKAFIFVLDLKGNILKKCFISNAKNNDWEDIATDHKGNLFIGDFGNNKSLRKNTCILQIPIQDVLNKEKSQAVIFNFQYKDQVKYPPNKSSPNFDAETLICDGQNLWIFTKCGNNPYSGISFVYKIPIKNLHSSISLKKFTQTTPGKRGWLVDSFTAGTFYKKHFYLSTYNRLIKYSLSKNTLLKEKEIIYKKFNQKEALAIDSKGNVYVANEKHKFLGPAKLHIFKLKK